MLVFDQILMKKNVLIKGGTIFNNTDSCAKQYRCAIALHFLSIFRSNKNVCIDWGIGVPGHGKDLVDGLNACDKKHLKKYMKHINQPHEGDEYSNINPYLIYITKLSHLLMNVEEIVWKD